MTLTATDETEVVRELLPAATIADLQGRDAPDECKVVQVLGKTTKGTGWETFYWDSASTDSDDTSNAAGLITTVLPTGHTGAGRWKRGRPSNLGLTQLATQATYTVVANNTTGTAVPTAVNISDFGAIRTFTTIALLKAGTARYANERVTVLGYYTAGDGGGGEFYWDSASSASDNGGTVLAPDAGGVGRWFRVSTNPLKASQFGCRFSADSQAAFDALLAAGAGDEILIDTTIRLDTGASVIPDGTVVRFLGKDAKIDYRGTGAALEIRNSKNIAIYEPHIDFANAGANAVGLWIRGGWHINIYKPKLVPKLSSHTGLLVETSQTGGNDYGAYDINVHDPILHVANTATDAGNYGIRARQTSGDSVSVTHLNVYSGWSKGITYGLYYRNVHSFRIFGFICDTATDCINIADSADGWVSPGELGGTVSGYGINWGTGNTAMMLVWPNKIGTTPTLGYQNNASYTPQALDQGQLSIFGSRSEQDYYTNIRSVFSYGESFYIQAAGGGTARKILTFGDAAGTAIDSNADILLKSAGTTRATLKSGGNLLINKTSDEGSGNFLQIGQASAGGSAIALIENTDNTNAGSHAQVRIRSGGTSSGDPWVRYTIPGATEWAAGVDNSDSDKYKVANNATLGTNDYLQITTTGSVAAGLSAPATNATNGFLYVPATAGTPTGAPTAITGYAPIVVDSTNNKLYFYSGGAWRDAGP